MAKHTVYGLPGVYNAIPLSLNDGDGVALAVDGSGRLILSDESSITISDVASTFDHGSNRDVDLAAEQITTASVVATKGVAVKAANANTGTIYVGLADVTAGTTDATDGFELGAGESVLVKVNNANKVYVIASAVNQVIYWLVV